MLVSTMALVGALRYDTDNLWWSNRFVTVSRGVHMATNETAGCVSQIHGCWSSLRCWGAVSVVEVLGVESWVLGRRGAISKKIITDTVITIS